jgi:lipoyl(octanoyl) transferase
VHGSDNRMRLVVDGPLTGAENMARDEALGRCHEPGVAAVLRAYRFSPPAVTIGRFQRWPGAFDLDTGVGPDLEVVRRPTGGLAILHRNDFTYSVVMGSSSSGSSGRDEVFRLVADAIVAALYELGIRAGTASHRGAGKPRGDWCFESAFGVDLEWRGKKICGSAQRVIRSSVLQHGSLFLQRGDEENSTPAAAGSERPGVGPFVTLQEAAGRDVGWEEVLDAFRVGFERSMGVALDPGTLSGSEETEARRLFEARYSRPEWLLGRVRAGHVRAL